MGVHLVGRLVSCSGAEVKFSDGPPSRPLPSCGPPVTGTIFGWIRIPGTVGGESQPIHLKGVSPVAGL